MLQMQRHALKAAAVLQMQRLTLNAAARGRLPANCLGAALTVRGPSRLAHRCKPPGPSVVAVLLRSVTVLV
jgi:hypothetical protein